MMDGLPFSQAVPLYRLLVQTHLPALHVPRPAGTQIEQGSIRGKDKSVCVCVSGFNNRWV